MKVINIEKFFFFTKHILKMIVLVKPEFNTKNKLINTLTPNQFITK
jgi:hypothetical protein